MKLPKSKKRYCPYCKKHTSHKIKNQSFRGLNKKHTMSHGSQKRTKKRGRRAGTGNLGRYSKGAMNSWKRYNKKLTKKSDLRFTCSECKKVHTQKKGIRAKKLEFV